MNLKSILLLSAIAVAGAASAQIKPGSIVVDSIGGTTSAANPVTLYDFSTAPNSAALGTYAVPSTGAGALTDTGSGTSDGALSLSGDGKTLLFAGYRADAGTAGVTGTSSTTNLRVVGTLSVATGAIGTTTTTTADSTNNIRSAYSFNSTTFYAAGAGTPGGITTGNLGSANTGATVSTATNARVVGGYNSGVYFTLSSGTAGASGLYSYDPTNSTANQTQLVSTSTTSPYGFQFLTATSILIADDTTGTGGIRLYTNTGSGFAATSTFFNTPTRSFAFDGSNIYYTSTDGSTLNSVSFSTALGFGTSSVLQTAATGTLFRGVAFVPTQAVPEPSAFAALGLGALGFLKRRRRSAK